MWSAEAVVSYGLYLTADTWAFWLKISALIGKSTSRMCSMGIGQLLILSAGGGVLLPYHGQVFFACFAINVRA